MNRYNSKRQKRGKLKIYLVLLCNKKTNDTRIIDVYICPHNAGVKREKLLKNKEVVSGKCSVHVIKKPIKDFSLDQYFRVTLRQALNSINM